MDADQKERMDGLLDNNKRGEVGADQQPSKKAKEMHEKEIVIKINPRILERLVFVIIIIILAYFAIFTPLNQSCNDGVTVQSSTTGQIVATTQQESTSTTTNSQTTTEDDSSEEETNTSTSSTSTSTAVDGEVTLTVDSIETNLVSDTYGKFESVAVTVTNAKETFTPLLQLFIYDPASESDVLNLHQTQAVGEKFLQQGMKKGQRWSTTIQVGKLRGYQNPDDKKTVIVKLLDYDTDELIKQVKREVVIT